MTVIQEYETLTGMIPSFPSLALANIITRNLTNEILANYIIEKGAIRGK